MTKEQYKEMPQHNKIIEYNKLYHSILWYKYDKYEYYNMNMHKEKR